MKKKANRLRESSFLQGEARCVALALVSALSRARERAVHVAEGTAMRKREKPRKKERTKQNAFDDGIARRFAVEKTKSEKKNFASSIFFLLPPLSLFRPSKNHAPFLLLPGGLPRAPRQAPR